MLPSKDILDFDDALKLAIIDYKMMALQQKAFDIEIKCPFNSGNHLQNFFITNNEQLKSKRTEYYWQMQMGMIAAGAAAKIRAN